MSLSSTLARFVDWRVRDRGREYYKMGQVDVMDSSAEWISAIVTGSAEYDVSLTARSGTLWASCSCPFFDRGEPCKHVWAAVLAADEMGGLRDALGHPPTKLVAAFSEAEAPEPFRPAPPTWRDTLGQLALRSISDPAPAARMDGREILYLLDVPATLKSRQLTVRVLTGRRQADGAWEAVAQPGLRRDAVPGLPEPDRTILSLLILADGSSGQRYFYSGFALQVPAVCAIPASTARILIPEMGSTGRLQARLGKDLKTGLPLTWDPGPPWEIWLEVREEAEGDCRLAAALRRGEERLETASPPVLLGDSGFILAGDRLASLANGDSGWSALLESGKALQVPAAERDELVGLLLAAPRLPPLELPESLRFEEARPAPRPRLRLLTPRWTRSSPRAELSFLYEGLEVTPGSPQRGLYQPAERRLLLRDPAAEERSAARLGELGFRTDPDSFSQPPGLQIPANRIPKVVPTLLAEGWSVEAEGKLYRKAGSFKIAVSSGMDWFDLDGEAEFEGETVGLPELLAAIHKGQPFIPLGDGSLGMLPEEWIRKLAPVAGLGTPAGEGLRFRSVQAVLLDAWLADEPEVTCDEAFERARGRLRDFGGIAPADPPRGFKGELRGYQRAGLGWLHFLREFGFGGCLADDMGLGKTVQVLALLESRRELRGAPKKGEDVPPSLVVVPRSLVFNWLAEAARFTPRLRVLDYTGADRPRDSDSFQDCDVVITTYGTLRKDVTALRQVEFDYVILDEAQAIKNSESQTAKAARLLRGRHRLALSGTPVENHLGELWSLLEFLNPGFLGASPTFRRHADELRAPMAGNPGLLARALRPLLLRRTKEQVAPELPPKLEQTLYCELPPKQRRLYDELRDHYRGSLGARIGEQGLGRSKILVLEALLRLRQAACHPGLVDPRRAGDPCAKLDLLLPQLREVLDEGHKALVFSQFTSFLAILRRQLDAEAIPYLYLDGRTRDRREKVETFQNDPGSRLFLISLKAGGLGLNLTGADYVYLLDPWWNPAVEAQAIDRAHRIGQLRPVFASRLVARDTVEEKILDLQKTKRDLADAVIQADKSLLAALSREDLEMLLS
ncbi:MAG TPA: DEAD/DEAH box helicase [Thermoanaerobaculia bacterium]